ncbi:protein Shroom isoform X3 [Lucilia sericata]|nr:protein Shroom isoform X3 [Lucilia sericata]
MQRNNNKRLSPTQESSNMSFSSASVAGSIQDDIGDQCGLTKAGLEEYTMRSNSFYDNPVLYHHQKQSSYAQSEGYHSYVSSSDSTSATPMLDRLRQESELLSRQTSSSSSSHHWSQNDLSSLASTSVAASPTSLLSSGRDLSELGGCTQLQQQQKQQQIQQQQHNNSSESTSSTETLKWLGSMSDVSEVSHATGFSAISESDSTAQLIVHSSRVMTPKRHQSESVLYAAEDQASQQQLTRLTTSQHSPQHSPSSLQTHTSPSSLSNTLQPSHRHSPSYPPIHQTSHTLYRHHHNHHNTSPELTKSMTEKTSSQTTLSNCDVLAQKSNILVTISNSEAVVTISPHPPPVPAPKPNTNLNGCKDNIKGPNHLAESQSQTNISNRSHGLPRQSSSLGMVGHKSVSASMDSLSDIKHPYRNNHRLFPVSTYTEPLQSNTSHFVHHPKPQYSTGVKKPQKSPQQTTTTSSTSSSTSSSSASSPSIAGSHGNLHQPKLGSPNYPQPSWQSVAALINDFERSNNDQQQPQKYTYLDPNKTHRVPNPALKAFQKNAVQSYFERQQQQQQQQQQHQHQNHAHSLDNLSPKSYQQTPQRPSSLQNPSNEGVQTVLLRNSLPSNYNTTSGQRPLSEDKNTYSARNLTNKPPSPAPPPPPPRSRSMMPNILRRSSSASDYAELRDQFISAPPPPQEKLQTQSIKNISNSEKFSFNDCGMPPPPPPPRGRSSMPPRRTSSAAEYAAIRDKVLLQQAAALTHQQLHPHQHQNVPPAPPHQHLGLMSNSYHHHHHHGQHSPYQQQSPQSYQTGLPLMPPPPPLQDNWVPERPPKNPNLRVPSPELPPPPPGLESETNIPDEPLPPPPPEILQRQPIMDNSLDLAPKPPSPNRRNSFAGASLRKSNYFNRSPSNDSVNVSPKGPPPLIPRKPASIELLQVSRPSAASLNQLSSTKLQPELTRATIISSSTRKRPHNLASTAGSSIPAIQENVSLISNHSIRHSPNGLSSPLHSQNSQSSTPPPPLMPRMPNVPPTIMTQQQTICSTSSNVNSNTTNQKSRCNSKASYLPRQSLEKQSNSDPDHGSYKMTLHSNEDLVTTTKSSTYDILAQTPKLPNNLPDVLPLGAKLQPNSNTSLNSTPSLRYGSNNNISTNSPTSQQAYTPYGQQSQQQQQQQRYSTPVLNTFNLSTNFTRSQSFDTNVHNTMTQSPNKYMTQSSLDLKKPVNNLETTLEEPLNLIESSTLIKDNNSSVSSLSSLSESCNSHEERLNTSSMSCANTGETTNSNSIFRAELVNTTFANNNNSNNAKKSVTRQESLRENIEKITQLQSQLMSAHITDNNNAFMGSYASQMSPQSNANKSSQANVIDIPKSLETEKIDEEKPCSDNEIESVPQAPLTPPPVEEELIIKSNSSSSNTNTCNLKSPKILEEEQTTESNSIISQLDTSTDSLKLVQRSEIILRVNASTVETASQTDDITDCELKSLAEINSNTTKEMDTPTRTTLQPRQRLAIEDDCEKMSKELAQLLPANDALINILCPPGSKTVADYVTNLYNPNVPLRPSKRDVGTSTLTRNSSSSNKNKEEPESCEKITVELKLSEVEQTPDNCDILKNKVDDLIKHLNNKVRILTKEQTCIDEESAINDELGNCLLNKLSDKVRPIEASKCRTYISDIGHITGLLLSLSERLARAENNLTTIDENNSEKKSLENKRDRLVEQLTEAKRLKEDIDRRGISVVSLLEKNLNSDEFADFEYFINMKAKLITDARDIADKIKMGEEIISALSDTLIQSDC